jgi:hypothetical protein
MMTGVRRRGSVFTDRMAQARDDPYRRDSGHRTRVTADRQDGPLDARAGTPDLDGAGSSAARR